MMMIVLRLLSLVGLKSRWHRHFSARPPNEVFFQGGGVSGFVDSWPETLVPSASNRSTPEWTLVDSVDSRHGPFDEQKLRARARQSVPPRQLGNAATRPADRWGPQSIAPPGHHRLRSMRTSGRTRRW